MDKKTVNNEFEYTLVMEGGIPETDPGMNKTVERTRPTEALTQTLAQAPATTERKTGSIDMRDAVDRLYYDYEKMCLREPTVLDKDDIYPHSYQWRTGDRYDANKIAALTEALKRHKRIVDTEAYQRYVEEVKRRRFTPVSWD